MTAIKVCGITRLEDAELAIELGAAAIGFIFAESPRRIAAETALAICARLPVDRMAIGPVGVFVGAHRSPEWTLIRDHRMGLQAHGDESVGFLRGAEGRTRIKAFRIATFDDLREVETYAGVTDYFLLDTKIPGAAGGTGRAFDRRILEGRVFTRPLILAGGMNPDTVGGAIRDVRPFAVDVSSGVESSPGRKDPARLRGFFDAVRAADESSDRAASPPSIMQPCQSMQARERSAG